MTTFLHALLLGIMASAATYITFTNHLPTWVLFLGWVSYVLFGNHFRAGVPIFIQQVAGIGIAIVLIGFGQFLESRLGPPFFHLAVFIILCAMYTLTKVKIFHVLPAYFIGMVIWFGANSTPGLAAIGILVLTLLMGYIFAIVHQKASAKIDAIFEADKA